ncbi:MAG: HIT family protein [Planctomycetota bacterium]
MAEGTLDADCIFCKIIRGEIPCQRIFDNEHLLAFLDINPLSIGHTVVIPKHHTDRFEELPADWAAEMGRVLGALADVVAKSVDCTDYNILLNNGAEAGQVVAHVHFHIIPRRGSDGLGYRWKAKAAVPEELTALAQRIRSAL